MSSPGKVMERWMQTLNGDQGVPGNAELQDRDLKVQDPPPCKYYPPLARFNGVGRAGKGVGDKQSLKVRTPHPSFSSSPPPWGRGREGDQGCAEPMANGP
jgi:hypothetical protein